MPAPVQVPIGGRLAKDSAKKLEILTDFKSGKKVGISALEEYRRIGPDVLGKPEYTDISNGAQEPFRFLCSINGMDMCDGTGKTKQDAKHAAAGNTLLHLDKYGFKSMTPASPQQVLMPAVYRGSSMHDPAYTQVQPRSNPIMSPFHLDAGGNEASGGGYPVTGPVKGKMLIINIQEGRQGSEHDVDRLRKTFTKIGFDIQYEENPTAAGILVKLQDFAMAGWPMCSAVIAILAHGRDQEILGSDGNSVSERRIYQIFDTENCPKLRGKPKLFIFQACRGENFIRGSLRKDSGFLDPYQSEPTWSNLCLDGPSRIPIMADMITAYATVAGYAVGRDEYTGSIFIQKLCDVFDAYARNNMHVADLLTKVNGEVAHWESEYAGKPAKQMSEIRHTLTKPWYLY